MIKENHHGREPPHCAFETVLQYAYCTEFALKKILPTTAAYDHQEEGLSGSVPDVAGAVLGKNTDPSRCPVKKLLFTSLEKHSRRCGSGLTPLKNGYGETEET